MGDEKDRQPTDAREFPQQHDHLRLDGDVESRRRFVRDQQLRLTGERHGNHDSLELTSGHLVRVLAENDVGIRDADVGQGFDGNLPC